jgi:hypothetical protein
MLKELPSGFSICSFKELDDGELGSSVDGNEKI